MKEPEAGALVAVTCERVKRALLNELGMSDAWYGRIHVLINPLMTNGQPALIGAKPYLDGWQYQVELPLWSEPIKLVRGIVHVLLLEIANRSAGVRSGEIPLWLSEGMTQCLVHSSLADLVIARPQQTVNQVRVRWLSRPPARRDPMKEVRERLQTYAAFSFARLGEIDTSQMSDESWRTFQASAHLFVDQLLQLPAAREQFVSRVYHWAVASAAVVSLHQVQWFENHQPAPD